MQSIEKTIVQVDSRPATLPVLKYPGCKRSLIEMLRPLWQPHQHRRLVDLTVGSAAIPLGLCPKAALCNDLNPHVVNLHQQLQRGLKRTIEMQNERAFYLYQRGRLNEMIASGQYWNAETAQLLYYVNRTCFNGVMRFNRDGFFNVGFGMYKTIKYLEDFTPWQIAYRDWQFCHGDFQDIPLAPDDFVVADPPYDSQQETGQLSLLGDEFAALKGNGFTGYSGQEFAWADQVRLANHLAQHPGPVLLFNAKTPRIQALYEGLGFKISVYRAKRSVSCTGDRTPVDEILATRNLDSGS